VGQNLKVLTTKAAPAVVFRSAHRPGASGWMLLCVPAKEAPAARAEYTEKPV